MQANGLLFGAEYLAENVQTLANWPLLTDEWVDDCRDRLLALFDAFPIDGNPNEATTESDLVEKVLTVLGWQFLPQQNLSRKGRTDVPDYVLFPNADAKLAANAEPLAADRYRHATSFLEAKAYGKPLDRTTDGQLHEAIPSSQILRYLTLVDTQTGGKVQWGILTNGRLWRVYCSRVRSRSEEYFEIDLIQILGKTHEPFRMDMFAEALYGSPETMRRHFFKLFLLFFSPTAFAQGGNGLIDDAVDESQDWVAQVAETLRQTVFNEVYPQTLEGLYYSDPNRPAVLTPEYAEALRVNGLYLLYRLLFIYYAEDRDLLPVSYPNYKAVSLQEEIRKPVAKHYNANVDFSKTRPKYYNDLSLISNIIDKGDETAGIPPYNGGLFNPKNAPMLSQISISDHYLAPIIDKLSRRDSPTGRKWINYRDMGVQQLGSIYEGLLEFEPALVPPRPPLDKGGDIDATRQRPENFPPDRGGRAGSIELVPNTFARKVSGSYYTPQPVVTLLLERSIGVYVKEFSVAFQEKVARLVETNLCLRDRNAKLAEADPASALLNIRVLDPAMGSGHFLVSVVDILADRALELLTQTPNWVPWQDKEPYVSPLSAQMREIKTHILALAKENRWQVKEYHLEQRQLARRMALKRCIYGVDKNSMAVELAKVALWLHTFTVGAPLSFLDHHIRWGDSLFGQWVGKTLKELEKRGAMFIQGEIGKARSSAQAMEAVEVLSDADITEVHQSAANFEIVKQLTAPLDAFLRLYHAFKWAMGKDKTKRKLFNAWLDGVNGSLMDIALGLKTPANADPAFLDLLAEARRIAKEEGFVNWEVAFPGVWTNWANETPIGGFHLVVGNPPWEVMKMQQVEWFAQRSPEIAMQTRAADRSKMIKALEKNNESLWFMFQAANKRTETAMEIARSGGEYPLLSGGDTNYYSLFIERAHALAKPTGAIGIVCPSGIAADKTAAPYFRSITTAGRLLYFYDFENKKILFPDVHASFKFCVIVAQNPDRMPVAAAELCFFIIPQKFEGPLKLRDKKQLEHFEAEIEKRGFQMTAQDFALLNPNTGTAPIFRTQRDAEITLRVYREFPVLFDHIKEKIWSVKYSTLFHMANDSHLFKTKTELELNGFYPSQFNCLKRGKEFLYPLYEGKMVQLYNHRAASIYVNDDNLFRPGQQTTTSIELLSNPKYYSNARYFVKIDEEKQVASDYYLAIKDVTASTNMRTMIAAMIPKCGAGHTLPILINESKDKLVYPYFLSLINSFIYDYLVRQKIHGLHLTWYSLEQIPVIPPETYDHILSGDYIEKRLTVGEFVKEQVLRLTYTAWDLQPFAKDLGYDGEPFVWNENDRRQRMARLDALYFLLYGCTEDEIRYILSTFPIVKEKDEKEFGEYRTEKLILNYFRALKAGDTDVWFQN